MFFCTPCRDENGWPGMFTSSYGKCESCGNEAPCFDIPSGRLMTQEQKIEYWKFMKEHPELEDDGRW